MEFKNLPNINWQSVFKRIEIEYECGVYKYSLLKSIGLCFVFRPKQYDIVDKGARVLCFQSYYERKSYVDQMNSFALLANADIIRGLNPQKRTFISPVFFFSHVLMWFLSLLKTDYPLLLKIRLVSVLINVYELTKGLKVCDLMHYRLLVTFCDSIIDEAFVTELFKSIGIKTASLQHGQYTSFRENKLINSGVEIRTFKSDYLFSWNQMTIDECAKHGIDVKKLKRAGILGYINMKYECCINPKNKEFGVIINHEFFEEDNIILVKAANFLARSIGYKYYLKLHPNYSLNHFDNIVDKDRYLGTVKKGIPILDYANMVEFSLASSSSVFCELIYLRHPVLRYSNNGIEDKYRDVPYGLKFSAIDNVVENYSKGFDKQNEDALFRYLCYTENVAKSYQDILNDILSKEL